MAEEQIGNWTTGQLMRFVQSQITEHEVNANPNKIYDTVEITRKLSLKDELAFGQSQLTVGAAGAASALPATPDAYVKVLGPDGVVRLIPLYKI